MPSPFPGMDPYLEDPGLWPDFHHRFISIASDLIAERVRPRYLVRIEERVYISNEIDPARLIVPDIRISARPGREAKPDRSDQTGGVEVAEPIEAIMMIIDAEIHEARLEIIDREGQTVVTVIELLSPTNKLPGSDGRKSFIQKRDLVMDSPSHWVEIDLLRGGLGFRHDWPRSPCEYFVHVSRAQRRPKGLIWPIRLSQRLPVITIPLLPEDPDASLDLQAVITTAYDRAGYDLSVDYTRDPVPPLTGEWSEWADRLLREKGLRTA